MSRSTASLYVVLRGVFPGVRVATSHILRSAAGKVSAEWYFCAQRSFLRRCYRKASPCTRARYQVRPVRQAAGNRVTHGDHRGPRRGHRHVPV